MSRKTLRTTKTIFSLQTMAVALDDDEWQNFSTRPRQEPGRNHQFRESLYKQQLFQDTAPS